MRMTEPRAAIHQGWSSFLIACRAEMTPAPDEMSYETGILTEPYIDDMVSYGRGSPPCQTSPSEDAYISKI